MAVDRILLSPPDVGRREEEAAAAAVRSGWVAPLGPEVDAFESAMDEFIGAAPGSSAALSSGSAGLEIALRLVGVEAGDTVIVPTKTFVASANAVVAVGATPVFIDVATDNWNLDVDLTLEYLESCKQKNELPAAVMFVDLYGTCSDIDPLRQWCEGEAVPIIEDAAEALGSSFGDRSAGLLGDIGVFSFNGNKIMTTSGGGMLVANPELANRTRWLASQAREPGDSYVHHERGYNYRLSNICAAIGRVQLERLPEMMNRRQQIRQHYGAAFEELGLLLNPIPDGSVANCWLSLIQLPPELNPSDLIKDVAAQDIEARRSWNPMHRQPLFKNAKAIGGEVADAVFTRSVCLPSGSMMSDSDVERVVHAVTISVR